MRTGRQAARLCAAVLALWAGAASSTARAWTEARVESAGAHLDVQADGTARVSLRIGVRVLGGWLSRLELDGLDPGLVLDLDKPPSLLSEDGQKLVPETRVERDGRVRITFPSRARAPHRGRHDLILTYSTRLASETGRDGGRTLRWSLPAFSADLRDVDVWVSAPAGTRAGGEHDGAVTLSQLPRGEHTILRWQRAQLPRTLVFEVALRIAPAVVRGAVQAARPEHDEPRTGAAAWAALCVLALAAWKRVAVQRSARSARARALPLLGLSGRPRAAASAVLALGAAWLYPVQPWLGSAALVALSACALDRGFARLPAPPQRWTRARYALELARLRRARAARLFGAAAWLDATTPLGFGLLAACYALALQRAALGAGLDVWLEALLACTPLWLSATRLALPPTPLEGALARRARALAAEPTSAGPPPVQPQPLAEPAGSAAPSTADTTVSSCAGADRRAADRAA